MLPFGCSGNVSRGRNRMSLYYTRIQIGRTQKQRRKYCDICSYSCRRVHLAWNYRSVWGRSMGLLVWPITNRLWELGHRWTGQLWWQSRCRHYGKILDFNTYVGSFYQIYYSEFWCSWNLGWYWPARYLRIRLWNGTHLQLSDCVKKTLIVVTSILWIYCVVF